MKSHPVKKGETLWSISIKYAVAIEAITKINRITAKDYIHPDQILIIPENRQKDQNSAPSETRTAPFSQNSARVEAILAQVEKDLLSATRIPEKWNFELLQTLRVDEAKEDVQQEEKVTLKKDYKKPEYQQDPARKPNSRGKKTINDVKTSLKKSLGREPHVVTFAGVKLTPNEKKQITVAVAICEMNQNGFGSINADQEFVGRKYGKRGIGDLTYNRILHIGLSYGVIQFTQDSGSLGDALKNMNKYDREKFVEIFGGGDTTIADSLLTLTSSGHPDVEKNSAVPLSGQEYWNSIRRTAKGQSLSKLANGPDRSNLPISSEIRGKRVQPLAPQKGSKPIDIWTGVWKDRFLAAGDVTKFQEAQLDLAVDRYFDSILPRAKRHNIRSALALAFIAACTVRGGVGSKLSRLYYQVALSLGMSLPITDHENERKCVEKIAAAHGSVNGVKIAEDESRRAALLIKDELGFLAEDLYDTSTY
jgi:LysM repeat protein